MLRTWILNWDTKTLEFEDIQPVQYIPLLELIPNLKLLKVVLQRRIKSSRIDCKLALETTFVIYG